MMLPGKKEEKETKKKKHRGELIKMSLKMKYMSSIKR